MEKAHYDVIGVMSGTSLDGVDLCHVKFTYENKWAFKILKAETIKYNPFWTERLRLSSSLNDAELISLDLEYTDHLSEVISKFIRKNKIENLVAVCSHGHTVLHQPDKGITYQIGNLSGLAAKLGQTVVCDFRVQDVELGGQGAPLVPVGDQLLFSDYDLCINLGGFANVSFEEKGERQAFDICPVNIVLNSLAKELGFEYDNNGSLAKSGKLIPELLKALNSLPFYQMSGPKSLGIEWVQSEVFPLIDRSLSIRDLLHTLTIHIAEQISITINNREQGSVLITGGGAYNSFLLDTIRQRTNHDIVLPEKSIIEFKEALIFGFLGVLRLRDENNCLSSVTGARRDHSSGKIFSP